MSQTHQEQLTPIQKYTFLSGLLAGTAFTLWVGARGGMVTKPKLKKFLHQYSDQFPGFIDNLVDALWEYMEEKTATNTHNKKNT